jgi:hypothetical protein
MRVRILIVVTTLAIVSACSRTDDGKIVVDRPGEVEVKIKKDTINVPTIGTVKDTINTPVVGVKEETLIVKKPVVGTKKTQIKRPVIKP